MRALRMLIQCVGWDPTADIGRRIVNTEMK